jgi:guanosine-3',5'-bis(diphosphate) 3'-pyrophosphohydrolase
MVKIFPSYKTAESKSLTYKNILSELAPKLSRREQNAIKDICLNYFEKSLEEQEDNSPDSAYYYYQATHIAIRELNLGYTSVLSILLIYALDKGFIDQKTLQSKYGQDVSTIISDIKKIRQLDLQKLRQQPENFIQLLMTLVDDVRSILIVLVYMIQEIRLMDDLKHEEKQKIAETAYYLYAQIAHRLGLYNIKNELENKAFSVLYADEYHFIESTLDTILADRDEYIETFLSPVKEGLDTFSFDYDIKWRTKSIHSIWKKMQKQHLSVDQIFDIYAIRIVLKAKAKEEKALCWQAYSIISNIYKPNDERLRDWITLPKDNGYESLHTTVLGPENTWVEVQIRTERMDEQAEKGLAAHWKYKGGKTGKWLETWLAKIREVLEDTETKIKDITAEQSSKSKTDEIFVFTPVGDLIKLKMDSTALDMAFNLHSELGAKCSGAKVNGKIVPLKHVLRNGDRVELLTNKKQKPKRDWLNFVITSKARNKIKRMLVEEEHAEAEQGKDTLKRKFRNWKLPFNDQSINFLIHHYKLNNALELYARIAKEEIDPLEIKRVFLTQKEKNNPKESVRNNKDVEEAGSHDISKQVRVEGQEVKGISLNYANCCKPAPGDAIVGFITIHKGISIHKKNCPNAISMQKSMSYRALKLSWENEAEKQLDAEIKVRGKDHKGVLNKLTELISIELNLQITSMNIKSLQEHFEGVVSVRLNQEEQFNLLMNKIKKIKGIEKVSRINGSE